MRYLSSCERYKISHLVRARKLRGLCIPVIFFVAIWLLLFNCYGYSQNGSRLDRREVRVSYTIPFVGVVINELITAKNNEHSSVRLFSLYRYGQDPHFNEITPKMASVLSQSDLVILTSRAFDPKISKFLRNYKTKVIFANEVLHLKPTVHYWLDPLTLPSLIRHLADTLCEMVPENCSYIRENQQRLLEELETLLLKLKHEGQHLSKKCGVILAHNAWEEFMRLIHIPVSFVLPHSHHTQLSPATLAQLKSVIKNKTAEGVKLIFIKDIFSHHKLHRIIENFPAIETLTLDPTLSESTTFRDYINYLISTRERIYSMCEVKYQK